MHRFVTVTVAVIALLALGLSMGDTAAPPASATAVCSTSGTVTATFMTTGPFAGLWQYCLSASWDTGGEGLSHISFLVTYLCECCDISNLTAFDSPAGTSTGENSLGEPCTAEYIGLGDLCQDDPTVPSTQPAIKFEQTENDCEAQQTGSGTWCFYSILPPLPSTTYPSAVAVKYGNNSCFGDLTGQMPDCTDCIIVPTDEESWGKVKARYR